MGNRPRLPPRVPPGNDRRAVGAPCRGQPSGRGAGTTPGAGDRRRPQPCLYAGRISPTSYRSAQHGEAINSPPSRRTRRQLATTSSVSLRPTPVCRLSAAKPHARLGTCGLPVARPRDRGVERASASRGSDRALPPGLPALASSARSVSTRPSRATTHLRGCCAAHLARPPGPAMTSIFRQARFAGGGRPCPLSWGSKPGLYLRALAAGAVCGSRGSLRGRVRRASRRRCGVPGLPRHQDLAYGAAAAAPAGVSHGPMKKPLIASPLSRRGAGAASGEGTVVMLANPKAVYSMIAFYRSSSGKSSAVRHHRTAGRGPGTHRDRRSHLTLAAVAGRTGAWFRRPRILWRCVDAISGRRRPGRLWGCGWPRPPAEPVLCAAGLNGRRQYFDPSVFPTDSTRKDSLHVTRTPRTR